VLSELLNGYQATAHQDTAQAGAAGPDDAGGHAAAAERAELARMTELAASADPWLRSTPLHFTASAVVVHPPTRRVLLRWHRRQGRWLQVGGHGDPGETDALAIALREAAEETGLTDLVPWPDASLRDAVVCQVRPSATEPAHEHADLRFVFATGQPDAIAPEDEASLADRGRGQGRGRGQQPVPDPRPGRRPARRRWCPLTGEAGRAPLRRRAAGDGRPRCRSLICPMRRYTLRGGNF
jgi:ADP-ribose pyrophosphatase YjhB (NUDIX family)